VGLSRPLLVYDACFLGTSLSHMDQQELYWTLAECVAWVRHRDDEAVNGCVDPGLSLEIPDEILQILRALRELHAAATGALPGARRVWARNHHRRGRSRSQQTKGGELSAHAAAALSTIRDV